jgi:bifunctional DNase/RNase
MSDSLFRAEILGVHVEPQTATTIVLLGGEEGDHRVLPIFVGPAEAQAIAIGLSGVVTPRPMTHDLLADVLAGTGNTIRQITVTELREGTFYAELTIDGPAGETIISCRPSDGIALATRLDLPVHVDRDLFELASVAIESDSELGEEEIEAIVSEFQTFLESAEPEDFVTDEDSDEEEDTGEEE